jgi:hypothetical protein
MRSMRSLMIPQRTETRRLPRVRSFPYLPRLCANICVDVVLGTAEAPKEAGPNDTPGGVVIGNEAVSIQAS